MENIFETDKNINQIFDLKGLIKFDYKVPHFREATSLEKVF
jgi:hypothetical protein